MAAPDLRSRWERLTRDTTFRVATLYAGASWFVVEAADTLGGGTAAVRGIALALAAGFLLLVPFVWLVDRRVAGGGGGMPAKATPADAATGSGGATAGPGNRGGERVGRGTRRWAGALLVLVVLAGTAWWAGAGRSGGAVPVEATRLAVIPFHVSGSESVRELGVGMVDLLSAGMNDVAGIRNVSGRTVLARLGEESDAATVSLERALEVGREVGAGSVLTGSVTAVGGQVRLAGQVRTVEGGEVLASGEVQGDEAEVLVLVDALAVRLLAGMWQSTDPLPSVRTAALVTTSPGALRAYLRGERLLDSLEGFVARYPDDPYGWYLLGDARFHAARLGLHEPLEIIQPFLTAVRLDPLFAMGRMLRWSVAYRTVEPGKAYLALARAQEDAGDHEEARRAYAHVIRLWEGADAYRQPEVEEARRALVRLSGEGANIRQ